MLKALLIPINLAVLLLITGCATPLPPGAEPGPHGTMAYSVLIEASEPGARIEADGNYIGEAPLTLKIYGDRDGTFHDFGSPVYTIRAMPVSTNQYAQTRVFRTGHGWGPEDRIPQRIYFDMNQPPPTYVPVPVYVQPEPRVYFGTGVYFGPRYYHDPYPRYYHGRPRRSYHHHPHPLPPLPPKIMPHPHPKR